jgi:hypothetical protein
MPVWCKFIGKLAQKPRRDGKRTLVDLDLRASLEGPEVGGVNQACAVLDPECMGNKQSPEQARSWSEGELITIEGQVIAIKKCECCGDPMFLVGA